MILQDLLTLQTTLKIRNGSIHVCWYSNPTTFRNKKELTDAAVIALKTRTIPIEEAISESLKALSWLKDCGCEQFILNIAQLLTPPKKEI